MCFKALFFSLLSVVLLTSCSGKSKNDSGDYGTSSENVMTQARFLSIEKGDGYTKVIISNPWDSTVNLGTYIIVPQDSAMPKHIPAGTLLRTPVKSLVVNSCVYSGVLEELGAIDIISGVTDAEFFTQPEIQKRLKNNKIVNLGPTASPSAEKLLALKPDLVMINYFEGMKSQPAASQSAPVIHLVDQAEELPLARAEWIRLFGLLTGKEAKADSIYRAVSSSYINLKKESSELPTHPSVLTDNMYQGVWYVPGGKSYQARILADAGADYPWKDNESVGSLSLSYEEILAKAGNADVWLIKSFDQDLTLKSLAAQDARYTHFDAFKKGNIWYSNTATSHLFEEFPFHPERLLSDYLIILHPEKKGTPRYFKKIGK